MVLSPAGNLQVVGAPGPAPLAVADRPGGLDPAVGVVTLRRYLPDLPQSPAVEWTRTVSECSSGDGARNFWTQGGNPARMCFSSFFVVVLLLFLLS